MANIYNRLFSSFLNKRPTSAFKKKIGNQLSMEITKEVNKVYSYSLNLSSEYHAPKRDFFYQPNGSLEAVHSVPFPQLDLQIRIFKRLFDIFFSLSILIMGLPIFIFLYFVTKFSSPGPAFYKQQRIGKDERPFYIYKFRSMCVGSEKSGPQLSSINDTRVTKWGRTIRSTRLDELPQFWNVLKGEMSVVDSRPERQHFIELIISRNPHYRKFQRLKPGITSIGQVYFGYAENIDQMCERMMYNLLYIQKVN